MRCAPLQAGENRSAISQPNPVWILSKKSIDSLNGLTETIQQLEGKMQSLMDWQSTTDSKILRQEEWQKNTQSTITQMVS